MSVPFLDLRRQYDALRAEIDAAVARVLASGEFILGGEVSAFEKAVAAFLGVDAARAVGVSNGSDALVLALRAAGLRPGDEVVTSAFTFVATGTSIVRAGGRPRFVDLAEGSFLLDPAAAAATGARFVVPVHLFGEAGDLEPLRAAGMTVVEDAAQAIGARLPVTGEPAGAAAGTFGAYSFYPTKNLGAAGDAGLVVAPDAAGAAQVRLLRTHGQKEKYFATENGYNMRLDGLQAAVLAAKLPHLAAWTARRRALAERYGARLAEAVRGDLVRVPRPADAAAPETHVWHAYTVRAARREALRKHLAAAGIATQVFYPHALHRMPAFAEYAPPHGLPRAEAAAASVLSLPIFPEMTDDEQDRVVAAIAAFYRAAS